MKRQLIRALALAACLLAPPAFPTGAQEGGPPELVKEGGELIREKKGDEFHPANRRPTAALIRKLRVPEGFRVNTFAEGLAVGRGEGEKRGPRMLAVGEDGTVYVTRPGFGDVLALRDSDGDGRADRTRTVVRNLKAVHGLALHGGKMYLATVGEVY